MFCFLAAEVSFFKGIVHPLLQGESLAPTGSYVILLFRYSQVNFWSSHLYSSRFIACFLVFIGFYHILSTKGFFIFVYFQFYDWTISKYFRNSTTANLSDNFVFMFFFLTLYSPSVMRTLQNNRTISVDRSIELLILVFLIIKQLSFLSLKWIGVGTWPCQSQDSMVNISCEIKLPYQLLRGTIVFLVTLHVLDLKYVK